uniref:CSON014534 protein n=1 Tax=Culicoides sonorensis TaxID=179676 RepID=A0A336MBX0_CULSO
MVSLQSIAIASIVFLIVLVQQGHAIRCYECNSHNDSRCAEAIPPEALSIDCDSRVIRGCGYDDSSYKNRCYQRSGFGGRQEVCACDTDNCNSATSMSLGFGLIIAILLKYKIFLTDMTFKKKCRIKLKFHFGQNIRWLN